MVHLHVTYDLKLGLSHDLDSIEATGHVQIRQLVRKDCRTGVTQFGHMTFVWPCDRGHVTLHVVWVACNM